MNTAFVRLQDRVLLIDDDELVAGSLRDCLVRNGRQVDVAVDLSSSVELMDARQYGVILVDPYLTGRLRDDDSLLDAIRTSQPAASLIVLTAYGSPSLAMSAERLHAAALLEKPQSVAFLSNVIGGACHHASPASSSIKGQPE
jgi:DNA-binding NtrC family response regulator